MNSKILKCEVMLTDKCNLRCKFCFEKNKKYSNCNYIEYNKIKNIVDICNDLNVKYLFLTGGEPLLYPDLLDILKYNFEKNNHPEVAIATNGILLEDKSLCYELINNGVTYIDISMKGKNSEEWIKDTGYNGLYSQLNGIKNLSDMTIEFTCSMVITPTSINSICERVNLAKSNGAKQFSFTFFIDNLKSNIYGYEYLSINNPFDLINNFIYQIPKLNKITDEWWVEYSYPICIYTEEQLQLLKGKLASPCHMFTKDALIFTPNGELLPCDMYNTTKLGTIGKEFTSSYELIKFITKDNYQSILKKLSNLPSENCRTCIHLPNCFGGCPVLWKNYSFDSLIKFKNNLYMKLFNV